MLTCRRLENAHGLRGAMLAAVLVAVTATVAGAQTRWQAWVGCWRFAEAGTSQRVCVVPSSSPSAVDIVTVDSGRVVARHSVDASGARVPIGQDGCNGWEQASWSKDGMRVFLKSELECNGGMKRTTTGIMSMTAGGQWVDVQTLKVAENEMVRTSRYVAARDTAGLPAEVLGAVASSQRLDTRTATLAAGGRLSLASVLEAARAVDTTVMQAWLVERREEFNVDGKTLVAMADAGVPGSVTDVLVALAYPDQFHMDREAMELPSLTRADSARIASSYLWDRNMDCAAYGYSPFGWGPSRSCSRYGYMYDRYRYGSAYGYGGYGYDSYYPGYYGYYTRPVVIVRGDDRPRGVAVNGQGYTRASSSSSSGSASRDEGSSSSSRGGSSSSSGSTSSGSSGSSSSGSSTSGSSSSSGSTGRTAKTRPPGE